MDPKQKKKRKPHKKHWYRITIADCPVCGRGHGGRERVYGEKPTDPNKRYLYEVAYDWCDV